MTTNGEKGAMKMRGSTTPSEELGSPTMRSRNVSTYRHLFVAFAVVLSFDALGSGSAEIAIGKGVAVCEAYFKVAKNWTRAELKCLGDLGLSGKGISRLQGEVDERDFSLDEDDSTVQLRKNAWTFVRKHDVNEANHFYADALPSWSRSAAQLEVVEKNLANLGKRYFSDWKVRTLNVDLDNDGVSDRIFVYPHCIPGGNVVDTRTYSSPLFLHGDADQVDVERTVNYLRRPILLGDEKGIRKLGNGRVVAIADFYANSAFGLFVFKGKTYFDFWWDAAASTTPHQANNKQVRIYLPIDGESRAVCAIQIAGD
jgi:hypothetical protein